MKLFLRLAVFIMATIALLIFSVEGNIAVAGHESATHKVTFVEIGSVNCIPCKAMQPIMKDIERDYKGQVKIVFHDVWTPQGKKDADKYNIRVIPTQVFLDKEGREFFRHEGFFAKEAIERLLKMKGLNK